MRLEQLSDILNQHPDLRCLTFEDVSCFVRLCRLAQDFVLIHHKDSRSPPQHLPREVIVVLAGALGQRCQIITTCWQAFRYVVWDSAIAPTAEEIEKFNVHGLAEGIGKSLCVRLGLCY